MSASPHRLPGGGTNCPRELAALHPGGADRLRWLVRRIAGDDREAFAEFIEHVSGPVGRRVRRQVADPHRFADIVAGTFIEVWWLAGGHVDPDTDVVMWINEIVRRRVANSRSPASSPTDTTALTPAALTAIWARRVEAELSRAVNPRGSQPSGTRTGCGPASILVCAQACAGRAAPVSGAVDDLLGG